MPVNASELVRASNLAQAALAREPTLDDETALIGLLEGGRTLHAAIRDALSDRAFWRELENAKSTVDRTQESGNFAVFAASQHVAILQLLGYEPPPPVRELVDSAIAALDVLGDVSYAAPARRDQVIQARLALQVFNARLGQLLEDRRVIPKTLHRSRLRRSIRDGTAIALALAPVALAYGTQYTLESLGIPGDAMKDVVGALVGYAATIIATRLPEGTVSALETNTVLGEIDGKARVRALATVVEIHLLRLNLDDGLDTVTFVRLVNAVDQAENAGNTYLAGFAENHSTFETAFYEALNTLSTTPTEANLGQAIRAWADVQARIEEMEVLSSSDFRSFLEKLRSERTRREAIERLSVETETLSEDARQSAGGRAVGAAVHESEEAAAQPLQTRTATQGH